MKLMYKETLHKKEIYKGNNHKVKKKKDSCDALWT
jgi:hypothetical protein